MSNVINFDPTIQRNKTKSMQEQLEELKVNDPTYYKELELAAQGSLEKLGIITNESLPAFEQVRAEKLHEKMISNIKEIKKSPQS